MIFILKVTTNKEDRALEMILNRATKKNINVLSIVRPHGLRGYLILETPDRDTAEEAAYNQPYVKGIIGKTITYDEIKTMIEPKVEDVNIQVGDFVEMIAEPFKKEQAKVTRIDKQKGEVVVTLLGASVPIPVTVKIDNVKVIRREEGKEQGETSNAEN
jgi:transcriptional antiterminator NusG